MMLFAIALASGGVAVSNKTHLPIVSSQTSCIAARLGAVAADMVARKSALDAAIQACRALSEASYAEGNLRMNGQPFPKSWWKQVQPLLDAEQADATSIVLAAPAGTAFKAMWELPDGKLVEVGAQFVPGTIRVRIIAA
ncbi:hypothetical protein HZY97_08785 [Sphingomonas sp. R-74633]|uniref:hypothetical protein n=1 Tax=Sphingomonas sp. R-74633 TaxID=2751188 RepID=UPI0015D24F39|nr:hypothetical protein [Sphingomonas sp. R-74633]NYT40847.1 hypothetical protein [Sphingomonas sp. R-74633]